MSHSSSPTDHPREWHVLLQGERLGPFPRDALRTLLDTHPEGWQASVWRLGMLDWRPAGSVPALTTEAPASEPPLVGTGAPLTDPALVRAVAPRDTAGELRVLSYEQRTALPRAPDVEARGPARERDRELAAAPPNTPNTDATGDWAAVGTSELRAIGTSEFSALSAPEPAPAETGDWAAVGTSELSAIGTSELRVLVTDHLNAQATRSELRAFTPPVSLPPSALPSIIVSGETSTELPSFAFRAERDAPSPARGAATPTPRALPVYRRPPAASRRPLPASLLIMGSLVLLSAAALGISLTLRWLRAPGPRGSHEHVYARAPLPPQREESLPQAAALPPPVPEPRDVETPPALAPIAVAAADATTHAEPAPRAAKRTREVGAGAEPRAARQNASVRVTATSAKVHLGNDVKAQVVCSLPRGTVRPVLAELPGTEARWFAVRCDAGAVGWVHESDLAPLAR